MLICLLGVNIPLRKLNRKIMHMACLYALALGLVPMTINGLRIQSIKIDWYSNSSAAHNAAIHTKDPAPAGFFLFVLKWIRG